MVLSADDTDQCLDKAQLLCRAITDLAIPHAYSAIAQVVTISAGVAHIQGGKEMSLALLFRRADEALYAAKEAGRNRALAAIDDEMADRRQAAGLRANRTSKASSVPAASRSNPPSS